MNWWAALALLRCISSSPAAAVNALRTRLDGASAGRGAADAQSLEEIEAQAGERVLDGTDDACPPTTSNPPPRPRTASACSELIANAEALAGPAARPQARQAAGAPRRTAAQGGLPARRLLPLHRHRALPRRFPALRSQVQGPSTVKAVTGELTPDEREAAVEQHGRERQAASWSPPTASPKASTCSSLFTAVVHYDLSWNPTRHEQREGRVDRFGQKAREVRSTMLYGRDNPVDGAVLQVILRKAESIRKELGVLVPMPDDEGKLTQALLNAVLLRKHGSTGNDADRARLRRAGHRTSKRPGRAPARKPRRTAPSSPSAA